MSASTTDPSNQAPGRPSALRVSAEAYFWKPGTAWFRALELVEYQRLGIRLRAPVLDLGCGDGRVSWMLNRLGLLETRPVGVDLSARQLGLATRFDVHAGLVQCDASRLPFPDGSFRSVLCNGVICSIPTAIHGVLTEIRRVLEPGGRAAISVPTDRFNDMLFWPRVLERMSPALADRYRRAMDARQPHYWMLATSQWRSEFEAAGLEILDVGPFFDRSEGRLYNVLSMHGLRIFGILRMVDGALARSMLSRPLAALLQRPFARSMSRGRRATATTSSGYVLFDVRRS